MGPTKSIMVTTRHHLPMVLPIVSSNLNVTVPSWSDYIFRGKQYLYFLCHSLSHGFSLFPSLGLTNLNPDDNPML